MNMHSTQQVQQHLARARRFAFVTLATTFGTCLLFADGNALRDSEFATVGKADTAWRPAETKEPGEPGLIEAAQGREGKPGVHLKSVAGSYKSAAMQQKINLPAGLYELTVWTKGSGQLTLKVPGNSDRSQPMRNEWNLYGLLFEWTGGEAAPVIGLYGDGVVCEASLLPATDAQKTAWGKQQEMLRQFGFVTNSAQRPTPGETSPAPVGEVKPLDAMTDRVVFYDNQLDPVWTKIESRLVEWLAANGFKELRSEALAKWMESHIKQNNAYGSVAVMTMGQAPATIAEEPGEKILWLRYLRAGGRVVWLGDLPFNYFQYPDARPLPQGMWDRGYGALGLAGGWNQPYWGRGLEVKITQQGKDWGFESLDGSITGFAVETISIPFGTYILPETGKLGASQWMKNLAPEMPWSGLVKMCQRLDGASDSNLRDIWRAAHYVGKPIEVPKLPVPWEQPKKPDIEIKLTASGVAGRTEFLRGEEVSGDVAVSDMLNADSVRLELVQGPRILTKVEQPTVKGKEEGKTSATINFITAPYSFGPYELNVTALAAGKAVGQATQTIGIRHVPADGFNWHAWVNSAPNPYRRDMQFEDIKQAGMEPHLTETKVEGMDAILRQNMGFSLRMHPDLTAGKEFTFEKNPEYFRLNNDGKPIPSAYAGGRPTLGISHPEMLENARNTMRAQLKPVANHPAFRPYVITNDDFSIYYGWDYSDHVVKRFKEQTGLDAPTKMKTPPHGVVDDNHPWLKWFEFTLRDVNGAMNRAETRGVTEARPDALIGPIPGGMQIPLIQLWEPAQYPPLNFGRHGFNMICSYYYNTYWQPVMTNTYWMEIGRMANHNLKEWCMPDLFMTGGYQRNNLFHLLAGGVKGLAYFTYDSRNPGTWEEVKHLAPQVRHISPVQATLQPASKKDIGLLVSLTTNCFDPAHDLTMVYAYHNLMQGHFDLEMTCEEEIMSGDISRYKAVLLYNVRWLRKSVAEALQGYIAKGGTVLLDNTIPFDLPGAKRVNIDIGMGKQQTLGVPPEGAHASVPGIRDYGDHDRIAVIQKALSEFIKPRFDCPDIRLVANRFEVGSVPYVWFVNAHTGQEYMFCRERHGAGHPGAGTPEKVAELVEWEKKEMASGPFTASATFTSLPGVPYDLIAGRPVKVTRTAAGLSLNVSMERFGGSLVAFYPEAINRVTMKAPATAKPMKEVAVVIQVLGKTKPSAGVVPVEVTLTDPSGKPSVLSGVLGAKSGTLVFNWTPAVNDLKGRWTVRAQELASGETASATVLLKE